MWSSNDRPRVRERGAPVEMLKDVAGESWCRPATVEEFGVESGRLHPRFILSQKFYTELHGAIEQIDCKTKTRIQCNFDKVVLIHNWPKCHQKPVEGQEVAAGLREGEHQAHALLRMHKMFKCRTAARLYLEMTVNLLRHNRLCQRQGPQILQIPRWQIARWRSSLNRRIRPWHRLRRLLL